MEKKSKLITEDNITMSDCLTAVRSMRNCFLCKRMNEQKDCKRCVPQVVVDEINAAVRMWFAFKKSQAAKIEKISKPEENQSSGLEDINYDF